MIDTWFKKDIEKILNTHQIVVLVDESKEAGFLIEVVKDNYQLFTASTEIDELRIKFENGDVYVYEKVPVDVFNQMNIAASTGKAFNALIKNVYNFRKVATGNAAPLQQQTANGT